MMNHPRSPTLQLEKMTNFRLSFLVGAITGAVTTPLDVIKTRLMIQVFNLNRLQLN